MPGLAVFAQRAERFTDAPSVSNGTTPGTAGILTGLLPARSGVLTNLNLLPGRRSLARRLAEAGFRTGAAVSSPVLRPGMGFETGFESFEYVRSEDPERRSKPRAGEVNRRALEWLDGVAEDEPFFLWVHNMEPHGPYAPPTERRALFPREAFDAPHEAPLLEVESGLGGIPRTSSAASIPSTCATHTTTCRATRRGARAGRLPDRLPRRPRDPRPAGVHRRRPDLRSRRGLAGDAGYWFSHENGVTEDHTHVPLLLAYPSCRTAPSTRRPSRRPTSCRPCCGCWA